METRPAHSFDTRYYVHEKDPNLDRYMTAFDAREYRTPETTELVEDIGKVWQEFRHNHLRTIPNIQGEPHTTHRYIQSRFNEFWKKMVYTYIAKDKPSNTSNAAFKEYMDDSRRHFSTTIDSYLEAQSAACKGQIAIMDQWKKGAIRSLGLAKWAFIHAVETVRDRSADAQTDAVPQPDVNSENVVRVSDSDEKRETRRTVTNPDCDQIRLVQRNEDGNRDLDIIVIPSTMPEIEANKSTFMTLIKTFEVQHIPGAGFALTRNSLRKLTGAEYEDVENLTKS